MSSILKAGLPTSQPRPPLKYATAAAAAVTPSASQQSNASASSSSAPTQTAPPAPAPAAAPAAPPPKPEPVVTTTLQQDHITAVTSSPSLTQISTSSPFLSSTSASAQQPDGSFGSPLVSEAESHPEPATSASAPSPLGGGESHFVRWLPFLPSSGTRTNNKGRTGVHEPPQEVPLPVRQLHVLGSRTIINRGQQSAAPPSTDGQAGSAWHAPAPVMTTTSTSVPEAVRSPPPLQPQQQQQPALASSPLPPSTQTQAQLPQFPPGVKLDVQRPPSALPQPQPQPQQQPQQPVQRNAFPGSLSDLVASFETVKQKGKRFFHRVLQVVPTRLLYSASPGSSCTPHDELGPGTQAT